MGESNPPKGGSIPPSGTMLPPPATSNRPSRPPSLPPSPLPTDPKHTPVAMPDGSIRKFNLAAWSKDKFSPKDLLFSTHLKPTAVAPLPKSTNFDNVKYCPPVYDQGELGSCTANGVAGIIEYNDIRFGKEPVGRDQNPVYTNISRLYQYWYTRSLMGTVNEDSGASIRDSIRAAAEYGTCEEGLWPYTIKNYTVEPPPAAREDGRAHRIRDYYRIPDNDIEGFKSAMASGFLITFGFLVYPHMTSYEMATTGRLRMPNQATETVSGGHCVLMVDYDDDMVIWDEVGGVLCRNSWGRWGLINESTPPNDRYPEGMSLAGHFWIPWRFFRTPGLCMDHWVIRSVIE